MLQSRERFAAVPVKARAARQPTPPSCLPPWLADPGLSTTMTSRAIAALAAASLLALSASMVCAAEPTPAELISSFRLKHGEVRVVRDSTLDRIARDQARAMAAKDNLSHEALGSFSSRIAPSRAGRAAENIAYGYDTFEN